MTARELRLHLAGDHQLSTRGLDWAALVDLHQWDHDTNKPPHNHTDDQR